MPKFTVEFEVEIEPIQVHGIEANSLEEAKEYVRASFSDGQGWITDYVLNTHWELGDVDGWAEQSGG